MPVIVGSNRDEYALYARERIRIRRKTHRGGDCGRAGAELYGADVDALIAAYQKSRPAASPWDLMIAIRSSRFHVGTVRLAEAQTKVAPTYMYSFDFEPTPLKAAHGAEIAFVFGNASADPKARPGAKEVEDAMSEAWIAFARTGNPESPGHA